MMQENDGLKFKAVKLAENSPPHAFFVDYFARLCLKRKCVFVAQLLMSDV